MVENSTLDLLLKYHYGELDKGEKLRFEYNLLDDQDLQQEAKDLAAISKFLDSALISPESSAEASLW